MAPPRSIPETQADRDRVGAILAACAAPWRYARDLAAQLGLCPTQLSRYLGGLRSQGVPVLLGAIRVTALRHPDAVPSILQAIAREWMDAEVHVVPMVDPRELSGIESEVGDVMVATGRLLALVRAGASAAEIDAAAADVCRQAHEAASAARGQ